MLSCFFVQIDIIVGVEFVNIIIYVAVRKNYSGPTSLSEIVSFLRGSWLGQILIGDSVIS